MAIEIEQPFGDDPNDLPLEVYILDLERTLHQLIPGRPAVLDDDNGSAGEVDSDLDDLVTESDYEREQRCDTKSRPPLPLRFQFKGGLGRPLGQTPDARPQFNYCVGCAGLNKDRSLYAALDLHAPHE